MHDVALAAGHEVAKRGVAFFVELLCLELLERASHKH